MVYDIIVWAAYCMAVLVIISLYFACYKLKIKYAGINNFLIGQLLVSSSLILLWFLDEQTKYIITPFIGLYLILGGYELFQTMVKFLKLDICQKDLYYILPGGYLFYLFFLYGYELLVMQVITLYIVTAFIFFKAIFIVFKSKHKLKKEHAYILISIILGFSLLYIFRVISVLFFDVNALTYVNLRSFQISTVAITYILQICLTFGFANLIFEKIRLKSNKLNTGFYNSPLSMLLIDDHYVVTEVNERFTQHFTYKEKDLLGKKICNIKFFKHVCKDSFFKETLKLGQSIHNKELSIVDGTGITKQVLMSISKIDNGDNVQSFITITDISEIYLLNERLNDYAYYDDLTHLPNRRYLNRYFNAKVLDNKRFALLWIDLNDFKSVNDTFGHTIGDDVLTVLGERLLDSLQKGDFVARYAGDEFLAILDIENSPMILEDKIKRIMDAIEHEFKLDDKIFRIRASMGLSEFPLHGRNLNDLIKKADTEMYELKKMIKSQQQK